MATGADWRVGDAEREAVAVELREQYAAGRLTMDEFRARLDAAYSAGTARELARVTADLPAAGPVPGPAWAGPGGPVPAGLTGTARRGHAPAPRRHRARLAALVTVAALVAVSVGLASLPHGALLVLAFLLLVVPAVVVTALAASAIWVGRRAWRSGAWLEVLPFAVGAPWLGRVVWLARAALVGRAVWQHGGRVTRPLRSVRGDRRRHRGYAEYQGYPGGDWNQARLGDLSGTTR
jgi:Domain of unknown function (DUF1707)